MEHKCATEGFLQNLKIDASGHEGSIEETQPKRFPLGGSTGPNRCIWGFCGMRKLPADLEDTDLSPGYVPSDKKEVILSTLPGITGGSQSRERHMSAKPRMSVTSAGFTLYNLYSLMQ